MRSMRGANSLLGALEIGDRGAAAVQRGQQIDQHDLPVESGEMIAEERPHHMRFVRLVAPFHHREERALRKSLFSLRIERREGEGWRSFKVARHQEAAWR